MRILALLLSIFLFVYVWTGTGDLGAAVIGPLLVFVCYLGLRREAWKNSRTIYIRWRR